MRLILKNGSFYIFGAILLIGAALVLLVSVFRGEEAPRITATVERGTVTELVSVSGVVEAENTAELAFPVTGIVRDVLVNEGSLVEAGTILARLEQRTLTADRQDAQAALATAIADREELISGPRLEQRTVTDTTVAIKRNTLERVEREENLKVANARRTLLSSDLEAKSVDPNEDAAPPTISGLYSCDEEGSYTIEVYASGAQSGYSYRVTGLERGTYSVTVEQPSSFGNCGLELQFAAGNFYGQSDWVVTIPNTEGDSYITNLNAYELAIEQAEKRIRDAEEALELALDQQTLENADPRTEALARADAAVAQARARLAKVNAQIEDRTLRAPFTGAVTDVSILPGETVSTAPVITVLADSVFELTARIPEIDITKIEEGQDATIIFDARTEEQLSAVIDFISPLATEIDGVAYYEATIALNEPPAWLRSGLNADVDIVVAKRENVMRVPTRFLNPDDTTPYVLIQTGNTVASSSVTTGIRGNDGYTEITSGLNVGDVLVAP